MTLAVGVVFGIDPAVREVKTVYILRMGGGLDQFLASELSKNGLFQVTTDPAKADALFTEILGESFEKKVRELYPPPEVIAKKEEKEKKDEKKDGMMAEPVQRVGGSTMGRGKGTIFLVERKSGNLLWSMHRESGGSAAKDVAKHARKIVGQLKKELNPKTN